MPATELTARASTNDVVNAQNEGSQSCENCHSPLNGPFCTNCGQEADSKLKYFWVVIMHLLDDIFSFDSRASRTIFPLLTRPAFLTNEYFAGRRVHYVPPLRLYLFISIIFFLTLKFFIAADNNKTITVSDKQALITQVTSHIKALKTERSEVEKKQEASNDVIDHISTLDADIAKFTVYLDDLNSDYSLGNNKQIIKLTRELIALEFAQIKEELPADEKERFDSLIASRLKAKDGTQNNEGIKIANNDDGTLSFDFLSDEKNKKVNAFAKELTDKAEKAFNTDTGPLIEQVIGKLPQLMFILLPLFAVLLKVMFIFSKRLYMEHLTVALHSHSFIFIAILLSEVLDVLNDYLEPTYSTLANFTGVVAGGILIWIPIYLFLMQRKVYRQGFFLTLVKFTVISTIYSFMILLTGLVAVVWGLMGI